MTNFSTMGIGGGDGPFVPFLRRFPCADGQLRDEVADISIGSMLHVETRPSAPKQGFVFS